MRPSRPVISLLTAPLLVLGVGAGLTPAAAAASPPAQYAAPYLQISGSDAGDVAADLSASGDRYYTLAFLIRSPAARRNGKTTAIRSGPSPRR